MCQDLSLASIKDFQTSSLEGLNEIFKILKSSLALLLVQTKYECRVPGCKSFLFSLLMKALLKESRLRKTSALWPEYGLEVACSRNVKS